MNKNFSHFFKNLYLNDDLSIDCCIDYAINMGNTLETFDGAEIKDISEITLKIYDDGEYYAECSPKSLSDLDSLELVDGKLSDFITKKLQDELDGFDFGLILYEEKYEYYD